MENAPVNAIQIEMDESPVRVEMAHLEHRIISKYVRQIKPALNHIMRAAAQFKLIELLDRRQAMLVSCENREFELGGAKFALEMQTKTLFRKWRERPAIIFDTAILPETRSPAGRQPFERGLDR